MNKSLLFSQIKHPNDVSDLYHIYNQPNILNVLYWIEYFEMVRNLEGSIVECGVGRGRSLITILSLQQFYKDVSERHVYALDSFEGFPEPSIEDESPRNPKKGEWSSSPNNQFDYSVNNLKKILNKANISNLEYTLIKGFFDKSTKELDVNEIAILHLDGDLYDSIKQPLINLSNKIVLNGIIVIDDYALNDDDQSNEAFPGARLAVEEFLLDNDNFKIKESIRGTPFMIRTR